jgi:pyruvate kinase
MTELLEKAGTRRTKIVCTLGPASSSPEMIRKMLLAGMDVVRLNFSHGDHDSHRKTIRNIRRICRELHKIAGILVDLGGPKIRLGELSSPERELRVGEEVSFCAGTSDDPFVIPVNYPYLLKDVDPGNRMLLADGLVELEVQEKQKDRLICRVIVGGVISSHKGVNLPVSKLRIPAFTPKDRRDLAMALEEEVDFVGVSFVRHERDLQPVKKMIGQSKNRPLLIAKIEKPQAVERLERILEHVDGMMVARGDLGVEMPPEEVPLIQKRIIRLTRQCAKPVITATQMLRSMVESPRATRAEVADVANAILDGTDAVMLSEESAVGRYPVEAVKMMDRIARVTEPQVDEMIFLKEQASESLSLTVSGISQAAVLLAHDLQASAIVACTESGQTARLLARFRPSRPVIALTPRLQTQRQLALSWGVTPEKVRPLTHTSQLDALVEAGVLKKGLVRRGDRIVLTAGVPLGVAGNTNLIRVLDTGKG